MNENTILFKINDLGQNEHSSADIEYVLSISTLKVRIPHSKRIKKKKRRLRIWNLNFLQHSADSQPPQKTIITYTLYLG